MVDSIFSPQHNASEDECRRMWSFAADMPFDELKRFIEAQSHDVRWTAIYGLYHLRRDEEGMAHALDQIQDREWASEMTYRDVYTTEELERMANNSAARERNGQP